VQAIVEAAELGLIQSVDHRFELPEVGSRHDALSGSFVATPSCEYDHALSKVTGQYSQSVAKANTVLVVRVVEIISREVANEVVRKREVGLREKQLM
jgi:hypothetical protein